MSTTISFTINSSDVTIPLGVDVLLNGQCAFTTEHVTGPQQINVDLTDDDGEHLLEIVLKNKKPEHTKINEQGEIIQDALLSVTNLSFDAIELGQILTDQAVYTHDCNGSTSLFDDKFYGDMGCNGTLKLKFATPIYLWLLEHM